MMWKSLSDEKKKEWESEADSYKTGQKQLTPVVRPLPPGVQVPLHHQMVKTQVDMFLIDVAAGKAPKELFKGGIPPEKAQKAGTTASNDSENHEKVQPGELDRLVNIGPAQRRVTNNHTDPVPATVSDYHNQPREFSQIPPTIPGSSKSGESSQLANISTAGTVADKNNYGLDFNAWFDSNIADSDSQGVSGPSGAGAGEDKSFSG